MRMHSHDTAMIVLVGRGKGRDPIHVSLCQPAPLQTVVAFSRSRATVCLVIARQSDRMNVALLSAGCGEIKLRKKGGGSGRDIFPGGENGV